MKTTLDLPDDLYRQVKSKSALEGRAVREVAMALFEAWVKGRAPIASAGASPAASDRLTDDAHEAWLARWRTLSARVQSATGDAAGLVDELHRDRR